MWNDILTVYATIKLYEAIRAALLKDNISYAEFDSLDYEKLSSPYINLREVHEVTDS